MYNGIGLPTPRGSGTNAYVQRNWANIPKSKEKRDHEKDASKAEVTLRKPNEEILDHEKKRKLELKCLEFEQMLEEQGYSAEEVSKKVDALRKSLMQNEHNGKDHEIQTDEHGKPIVKETHEVAEAQHKKNERLRQAFGISEYFVEGSSLDPERHVKEAAARAAALASAAAAKQKITSGNDNGGKYSLVKSPSPSPQKKIKNKRAKSVEEEEEEEHKESRVKKRHRKRYSSSSRSSSESRSDSDSPGRRHSRKSRGYKEKNKRKRERRSSTESNDSYSGREDRRHYRSHSRDKKKEKKKRMDEKENKMKMSKKKTKNDEEERKWKKEAERKRHRRRSTSSSSSSEEQSYSSERDSSVEHRERRASKAGRRKQRTPTPPRRSKKDSPLVTDVVASTVSEYGEKAAASSLRDKRMKEGEFKPSGSGKRKHHLGEDDNNGLGNTTEDLCTSKQQNVKSYKKHYNDDNVTESSAIVSVASAVEGHRRTRKDGLEDKEAHHYLSTHIEQPRPKIPEVQQSKMKIRKERHSSLHHEDEEQFHSEEVLREKSGRIKKHHCHCTEQCNIIPHAGCGSRMHPHSFSPCCSSVFNAEEYEEFLRQKRATLPIKYSGPISGSRHCKHTHHRSCHHIEDEFAVKSRQRRERYGEDSSSSSSVQGGKCYMKTEGRHQHHRRMDNDEYDEELMYQNRKRRERTKLLSASCIGINNEGLERVYDLDQRSLQHIRKLSPSNTRHSRHRAKNISPVGYRRSSSASEYQTAKGKGDELMKKRKYDRQQVSESHHSAKNTGTVRCRRSSSSGDLQIKGEQEEGVVKKRNRSPVISHSRRNISGDPSSHVSRSKMKERVQLSSGSCSDSESIHRQCRSKTQAEATGSKRFAENVRTQRNPLPLSSNLASVSRSSRFDSLPYYHEVRKLRSDDNVIGSRWEKRNSDKVQPTARPLKSHCVVSQDPPTSRKMLVEYSEEENENSGTETQTPEVNNQHLARYRHLHRSPSFDRKRPVEEFSKKHYARGSKQELKLETHYRDQSEIEGKSEDDEDAKEKELSKKQRARGSKQELKLKTHYRDQYETEGKSEDDEDAKEEELSKKQRASGKQELKLKTHYRDQYETEGKSEDDKDAKEEELSKKQRARGSKQELKLKTHYRDQYQYETEGKSEDDEDAKEEELSKKQRARGYKQELKLKTHYRDQSETEGKSEDDEDAKEENLRPRKKQPMRKKKSKDDIKKKGEEKPVYNEDEACTLYHKRGDAESRDDAKRESEQKSTTSYHKNDTAGTSRNTHDHDSRQRTDSSEAEEDSTNNNIHLQKSGARESTDGNNEPDNYLLEPYISPHPTRQTSWGIRGSAGRKTNSTRSLHASRTQRPLLHLAGPLSKAFMFQFFATNEDTREENGVSEHPQNLHHQQGNQQQKLAEKGGENNEEEANSSSSALSYSPMEKHPERYRDILCAETKDTENKLITDDREDDKRVNRILKRISARTNNKGTPPPTTRTVVHSDNEHQNPPSSSVEHPNNEPTSGNNAHVANVEEVIDLDEIELPKSDDCVIVSNNQTPAEDLKEIKQPSEAVAGAVRDNRSMSASSYSSYGTSRKSRRPHRHRRRSSYSRTSSDESTHDIKKRRKRRTGDRRSFSRSVSYSSSCSDSVARSKRRSSRGSIRRRPRRSSRSLSRCSDHSCSKKKLSKRSLSKSSFFSSSSCRRSVSRRRRRSSRSSNSSSHYGRYRHRVTSGSSRSRRRSRSSRSRRRMYSSSCTSSSSYSSMSPSLKCSRSPSIRRRKGSPSFLDRRRITRRRYRLYGYKRPSSSVSSSSSYCRRSRSSRSY